MMTKEGSIKIIIFMTPGAGVLLLGRGHIIHIVKMHQFFNESFSLLSKALIRHTKYIHLHIVMITKEGCTKIVNFICHHSEYVYYLFSIKILHVEC